MKNVYDQITANILAQLNKGIVPWHCPWKCTLGARSYSTGKPYSLLNQWLLGMKQGEYLTFAQIQKAGGRIKAGEKPQFVVFWKMVEKVSTDADGNEKIDVFPVLKSYYVWHTDQLTGIEPKQKDIDTTAHVEPIEAAENIVNEYFNRESVKLFVEAIDQAFYRPSMDEIHVPTKPQFGNVGEFYSTLFHEMTHSTGHETRLNRASLTQNVAFSSDTYSKEELVAEIGAAYLCNEAGIENTFDNSVAYIQSWAKRLKEDNRLIVSAAGKAEAAVKYIITGAKS